LSLRGEETAPGEPRLAILISGQGSNMRALIDACASGQLAASVGVVISNNPQAAGLAVAASAGIPVRVIDHRSYPNREAFDTALLAELSGHSPALVVLAGFMRILTSTFIQAWAGRLLNIHPSLLPLYPGLNTHQRALDAGDAFAGSTVHFVTPELDGGPPVLQARVPVRAGDSAQTLAARVQALEHEIYPLAVGWFLENRLQLRADGAYLDGDRLSPSGIEYHPGPG